MVPKEPKIKQNSNYHKTTTTCFDKFPVENYQKPTQKLQKNVWQFAWDHLQCENRSKMFSKMAPYINLQLFGHVDWLFGFLTPKIAKHKAKIVV